LARLSLGLLCLGLLCLDLCCVWDLGKVKSRFVVSGTLARLSLPRLVRLNSSCQISGS
jgi:hypothetical protein